MLGDDLVDRVSELIFTLAPAQPEERAMSLRLIDDLGYDSLGLLDLATEICVECELEPFEVEELNDIVTAGDVVTYVRSLVVR
jgi:acyl carrier protein